MDVEKTMQFLLEQQARFDARFEARNDALQARIEAMQSRMEAERAQAQERMEAERAQVQERMEAEEAKSERRYARIDRYIARGARMLARERGMRMEIDRQISTLVIAQQNTEQKFVEIGEAHRRLEEAQRQTEISLRAFIDSLRKPSNGN